MSVIHPGSSINFDAATLQQNQDEDEMLQEELRQQKELRELLSAELSDGLLEDDHSSVNDSHRSLPHDGTGEQHEEVDSPVTTSTSSVPQPWMQGVNMSQSDGLRNGYYATQMNAYGYDSRDRYDRSFTSGHQQYYDPSYGVMTSQPQEWHHHDYGNNAAFHQVRNGGVGQYIQYGQGGPNPHQVPHGLEDNGEYPYAERGEVEGREDYGDVMDGRNQMQQRQQQQYIQYKPERNMAPVSTSSLMPSSGSKASYRQSFPPHVKHFENGKHVDHGNGYGNIHDISAEGSQIEYERREGDKLQQEFNKVSNDLSLEEKSRQIAQIQILYKARGKKVDELNRELDQLKSEAARDKRILNHQLAMTKDQKEGMGTSLEESQRLVQEKDRDIKDLKGRLDAQSAEIESLKSSKNELLSKIQVSERTIESLHEQLTQLSHSETIERAREQHDAVLNAATQRHEVQILKLTTQLDERRQELDEKKEELEKARFHLNKVARESEQTLLDKTEAINRLTKSLEEAQNQCQGLLAGSSENAIAKHQVSDLLMERKQNEEDIAYLKMQVHDVEEHLKLYENALQLGAGARGHLHRAGGGGGLSDSLGELTSGGFGDLVKKLDWTTPQLKSRDLESGSQEELLDGLRAELQRSLKCNKAKRDEVAKLKAQCSELEEESAHWRKRAGEAQTQLKLNKSIPVERHGKEENIEDSVAIEELEEKLRLAEEEMERLEKISTEVKQRMAEMIQEHDRDKQNAVERCERALMQLHEDAKRALRDEMISDHEQKIYELSVEHDAKIRELHAGIEELQQELYDVKQSYVHVCAEKDGVQLTVQQQLLEDFEKEKEAMLTEHQDAIQRLEGTLEELESDMKTAKVESGVGEWEKERERIEKALKAGWEKERESEFTQRMDTQIALAKVNWFEEFSSSKQKAILNATQAEEQKWIERIDELKQQWKEQSQQDVERRVDEAKELWETQKGEEIQKLRDEFQSDKEAAVKMATGLAELNKNLQKEGEDDRLEQRILEVEEAWKKDKQDALAKAQKSWILEEEQKIEDVKTRMEREMESERAMQKELMEKAVLEVKKVCDQENQCLLKQKNVDMDKEIRKLQDQHRQDYEKFVEEHKKTLNSFLEREKLRSRPGPICRDGIVQTETLPRDDLKEKERLWLSEKQEMEGKYEKDLEILKKTYEEKLEALRRVDRDLATEKNNIAAELQKTKSQMKIECERAALQCGKEISAIKEVNGKLQSEIAESESKLKNLTERQKSDIERLKERMREEYRRWKKERATLIAKLKEIPSPVQPQSLVAEGSTCKFCQNSRESKDELLKRKDEATRQAIAELTEIYAETLKLIKDEMMTFVRESRGRTKETLSKERKRVASKLRSRSVKTVRKLNPESSVPRLKVFESDTDSSRPQSPVLNHEITSKIYKSATMTGSKVALSPSRKQLPKQFQHSDENDSDSQYPTKLARDAPAPFPGHLGRKNDDAPLQMWGASPGGTWKPGDNR